MPESNIAGLGPDSPVSEQEDILTTTTPSRVELDLPAPIVEAIASFLDANPKWSIERLEIAAFSQYLLQTRIDGSNRHLARLYLDALFAKERTQL